MPKLWSSAEGPAQTPAVFRALGDQKRLDLLARLAEGEPLSITQLTAEAGVTRQAITKHLHVLEEAGLVHGARCGREQRWELDRRQLESARRTLDRIADQWEKALGRLRDFVEGADEA